MLKNAIDVAIGVKRTWFIAAHISAFDPKRIRTVKKIEVEFTQEMRHACY
jgi:hypothetical protein